MPKNPSDTWLLVGHGPALDWLSHRCCVRACCCQAPIPVTCSLPWPRWPQQDRTLPFGSWAGGFSDQQKLYMDPNTKLARIAITPLDSERNLGTAVLLLLLKKISESHLNESMMLCCYGLMGSLQRFGEWNANESKWGCRVYSQNPLSQVIQNPNKQSLVATGPATPGSPVQKFLALSLPSDQRVTSSHWAVKCQKSWTARLAVTIKRTPFHLSTYIKCQE